MATSFAVRQFYAISAEYGTFLEPNAVFVVTGSISRLLVNDQRTDLSVDQFTIETQNQGTVVLNSGQKEGWWPGASTNWILEEGEIMPGIIVGGNDEYDNTSPDGRPSRVSVWGFSAPYSLEAGVNQINLDTAFVNLVNYILGTSFDPISQVIDAKNALVDTGFYYQYPVGYDGQSPNTGDGSDIIG